MSMVQTNRFESEVESFREQGYAILRGVLDDKELAALREESMAQIQAGPEREPQDHFKSAPGPDGTPRFFRIESVFNKKLRNDSVLLARGHPTLLDMMSCILPGGFVCWADALLWKGAEGGPGVPPHSGHSGDVFNFEYENMVVDLYLDESNPSTGCLRVLPGTNRLSREENRALLEQGWDAPGFVDVVMEPGDVLFHSEWMIHGSKPTPALGKASRRVLYFAVMDPMGRMNAPSFTEDRRSLATHMRRTQIAIERRSSAYPGETPFTNPVAPGWEAEVAAISEDEAL